MAKLTAYTKCAGEIVELSRVGYSPLSFTKTWTKYEGQERFVRTILASGVKPTATNDFEVWEKSPKDVRHVKFGYLGGTCSACGKIHFAERQIERPANPSNHQCDGRCMSARGPKCECSCGGKNHGSM